MQTFDFAEQIKKAQAAGKDSLEFLRVPALSLSTYRLAASGPDPQQPHTEHEVYYVVHGRARFRAGSDDCSVEPGTVLFVAANVEHRFHSISEDLELLVVFAPAKGMNKPA
jgi:mannose-6-phosphate isomerase-like protein (cupin superfamily)